MFILLPSHVSAMNAITTITIMLNVCMHVYAHLDELVLGSLLCTPLVLRIRISLVKSKTRLNAILLRRRTLLRPVLYSSIGLHGCV